MDNVDRLLLENLKKRIDKKEEILQLDQFINRYSTDDQYDGALYVELFNTIMATRIKIINEK
jgi:hypothetical protein